MTLLNGFAKAFPGIQNPIYVAVVANIYMNVTLMYYLPISYLDKNGWFTLSQMIFISRVHYMVCMPLTGYDRSPCSANGCLS